MHFAKCGPINDVRIVRDSKTGIGKGFGYVNFAQEKSVKMALDIMSGTTLDGRKLRISKSVERPKKTMTMVPKVKTGGAFPIKNKELIKAKGKVIKMKKKEHKPSFEGSQSTRVDAKQKQQKKRKLSQGERKRKVIAKKLLGK